MHGFLCFDCLMCLTKDSAGSGGSVSEESLLWVGWLYLHCPLLNSFQVTCKREALRTFPTPRRWNRPLRCLQWDTRLWTVFGPYL